MIPQVGDEIVISFTGKVGAIFTSPFGIDVIYVVTEQEIGHTFWPAEEKSVSINVLAKGQ